MATVGSLLVAIRARLDPSFHKETEKATSWADKFSSKLTNKLVGAGAAIRFVSHGIGTLVDSLEKMSQEGATAGEVLRGTLEGVAKSIPFVGDSFFRLGQLIRSVLDGSAAEMRALNAELESMALVNLEQEGRRLENIGKIVTALRRQIDSFGQAKELFDARQLGASAAVLQQIKEQLDQIAKLQAMVTFNNMINDLAAEYALLTQGAEAAERYRLALQGLSEAQIELLMEMRRVNQELIAQKKAAEEAARAEQERTDALKRAGDAVRDSIMTPLERYRKELEKLKELLEESAITQDEFARAVAQAQAHLRSTLGGIRKLERPGAVEQRFTQNFPGADRMIDPLKDLQQTNKGHFLEARKQTIIFNRIESLLSNQEEPDVVTF